MHIYLPTSKLWTPTDMRSVASDPGSPYLKAIDPWLPGGPYLSTTDPEGHA